MISSLIYITLIYWASKMFNAGMDVKQFRFHDSIFGKGKQYNMYGFWGSNSWKRKYSTFRPLRLLMKDRNPWGEELLLPPESGLYGWYHSFFNLKFKERFPLSATALVFLTDGWHLMQLFMWLSYLGAIAIAINSDTAVTSSLLIWFMAWLKVSGSLVFELFYSQILIKRS